MEPQERAASPTQALLVKHYRDLKEKLAASAAAHERAFEMCQKAQVETLGGVEVQDEWENLRTMAQEALPSIVRSGSSHPELLGICTRYLELLKTPQGSRYVECLREMDQTARHQEVLEMMLKDFRNSHTTSLWREVDPLKQNPPLKAIYGSSHFWNKLGSACLDLAKITHSKVQGSKLAVYIVNRRRVLLELEAVSPSELISQSSELDFKDLVTILSETGRETLATWRFIKAIAHARPEDDVHRGFEDYLDLPPELLAHKQFYRQAITNVAKKLGDLLKPESSHSIVQHSLGRTGMSKRRRAIYGFV